MHRTRTLLLTLVLVALASFATTAHGATAATPPPPVLDAAGHVVEGPIRAFVLAHGGLEQVGQPLTDALLDAELGAAVQYFTYARLEQHGDEVSLTRLGSLKAAGREGEAPFQWLGAGAAIAPGRAYVAESGHTLGGAFAWYHSTHGGDALLGYPISEEFDEAQPDGSRLLVQYFERARLSYHPDRAGTPDEIQREPLGAWMAGLHVAPADLAPRRPVVPLARATMSYRAGSAFGANIELAAARLDGAVLEPGKTFSFLGAVGAITKAAGFKPAPAIVGGAITDEVGGGVCAVSTLLYRAAWSAGLPTPERRAHSLWLAQFADAPGLDAAVADPGQDLRVTNDTGERIYVVASAAGGRATLTLWGRGDGRSTTLAAPKVADGEVVEVVNARTVKAGSGAVMRRDRVVSRYQQPPTAQAAP